MLTTMQAIDDDAIDLREFGAALKRRWRYLVAFTLSGFALGCVVSLRRSPQVELSMYVDLSKGPRALNSVGTQGLLPVNTYQPVYQTANGVLLLQSLLSSSKATPEQLKHINIGLPSDMPLKSPLLLKVAATFPSAQAPPYQSLFEALSQDLIRHTNETLSPGNLPPQSGFVHQPRLANIPHRSRRDLSLGGLVGLVAGTGAALLADRCTNRVFSAAKLQHLLDYPVLSVLPRLPWISNVAQVELEQLGQQLDPRLNWMVLSTINQHPCVEPLASALKLPSAAPLLTHTVKAVKADQPAGVLLVVEPGFNSMVALQETRRTLDLLPWVESVGLVLIQNRELPELAG